MTGTFHSRAPEPLGDGLVLRSARADDIEAIVALVVSAFGASDEPGVRGHLSTARALSDWTVVTAPSDGPGRSGRSGPAAPGPRPRIVAASGLLAHEMVLDGVAFPAGQVEYVVTDPAFRRRGLVRGQFAWHHRRADERGDLALFITGIPYLYRRFGYGYGIDYPTIRVPGPSIIESRAGPELTVRTATDDDLPAIRRLDSTRSSSGLRVRRDDAAWQVITTICRANDFEQSWVLSRVDPESTIETVVGWFRTQRKPEHDRCYLAAAAIDAGEPASSTLAMIRHAGTVAGDDTLVVWDIPDTAYGGHLVELGDRGELGQPMNLDHGIYVRVPDPVALLDHLRPLLSSRLTGTRYADRDGRLVLSLYDSGVALDLVGGQVATVRAVPGVEDPFAVGGVGIAPDWFGALVFGRLGAIGLESRADDVTLGRRRGLMEVLFPRRPSDVVADL